MEKYRKKILYVWLEPEIDSFQYNDADNLLKKHTEGIHNKRNKILYLVYTKIFNNKKNDSKIRFIASIKEVILAIKEYQDIFIFVTSYRVIDRFIINFLNILFSKSGKNITSIYIQHGRYTNLKRKFTITKNLILKSYFYFMFISRSLIKYPLISINSIRLKPSSVDFGFIYNPKKYWLNFHKMTGIIFKNTFTIIDRDLNRFKLENNFVSNEILYISQTFVEDTRCTFKTLLKFTSKLEQILVDKNLSLEVRPHPRSKKNIIDRIFKNAKILNPKDKTLRKYLFVVTHTSSLAMLFMSS